MPCSPKPWYRQQTGWWMAQINRKKEKLVQGPRDAAHKKLAKAKLQELLAAARHNPPVTAKAQTVASVIDRYLTHAKAHCCPDAYYQRQLYLQLFAEAHGFRKVNDRDCLPVHGEEWIAAHPEWKRAVVAPSASDTSRPTKMHLLSGWRAVQ